MKILYFDCPTGISGDMCLAALLDLGDPGLDIKKLKRELKKVPVAGYELKVSRQKRHAITGTRFKVKTDEKHPHRKYRDILDIIDKSKLSKEVKELGKAMFDRIAVAEGRVHGISPMEVEFHEVGAVDSIVDIMGVAIAMYELEIGEVHASPIPLGSGSVNTMHGILPIPAPATLEIIEDMPVVPSPITMELTTPTGAVILKTLCKSFGMMPAMTIKKTGYGVGGKDFKELANVLRVVLGENETKKLESPEPTELLQIETNIDDMSGQVAGYLMERLFEAGAVEAFFTPAQMKKSRPGILITVLAEEKLLDTISELIFAESSSIGLRYHKVSRKCLEREVIKVTPPYGTVRVKVSRLDNKVVNISPEYEDCKALAREKNVPIKDVMDAACCIAKTLV